VRRCITIEPQDAKAAARHLAHRGTSHCAEAGDDGVPALGHESPLEADTHADHGVGLFDHHFLDAEIERETV
jgi:hypothetical protein